MKTTSHVHGFAPLPKITVAFFLVLLAGLLSPAASAAAAETGSLAGVVSNTATGQNLAGAEVTLSPGGGRTLTLRDGRYEFTGLAPGAYTVTATYSGLDPASTAANVTGGRATIRDLGLTSAVYKLEKFVVEGEREGNALAITERRNAGNVKDVISSDAFGNVADLNLGNFLQRMPGISKEESEGEIYLIRIRGVDSNLNAVSIDGTRGANGTTRSLNRGFEIDKVPADFIETIEVTKAATPDMDADSIGGRRQPPHQERPRPQGPPGDLQRRPFLQHGPEDIPAALQPELLRHHPRPRGRAPHREL